MTGRSDVERLLDTYLAEGPESVADRVIDAALDEIDSTQQRRGPVVPWRTPSMKTPIRLLLVAAALAAAGGGAYLLGGAGDQPAPTPTTSPSPSVMPVRLELIEGMWHGSLGVNQSAEFVPYDLSIGRIMSAKRIDSGRGTDLGTFDITDGQVRLDASGDCPDPATYTGTVTADLGEVSFTVVTDSCDERVSILDNVWRRAPDGTLVPGTTYHITHVEQPLAFLLPIGFSPPPGGVVQGSLASAGRDDYGWIFALDTGEILVYAFVDPLVPADPCRPAGDLRTLTSVDALVAWNEAASGITVEGSVEGSIGSRRSITVDRTAGPTCTGDAGLSADQAGALWLVSGDRERLVGIDLGGHLLAVGRLGNPDTAESVVAAADDLVRSIQFR